MTHPLSTLTAWAKGEKKHPTTEVLASAKGHVRDYRKGPYEDYYASRSGMFGFLKGGPGAEDKKLIICNEVNGVAKAYRWKN